MKFDVAIVGSGLAGLSVALHLAETRTVAIISKRARLGVVNGLGVWWRKLGADGTNVNQLTSQNLTDMGRGPTFYDCLVEVIAASA